MIELSYDEQLSIDGGSWLSSTIITLISYMFYNEGKTVMEASSNGGNAAAVVAFK